jgi:thiamine biosynthesis lipoprotein
MGSSAHVIVVGGLPGLVDHARSRLEQLEQRWSRFRPDSEVSRLNAGAGGWMTVSPDTRLLVRRAVDGWRLTAGLFDPTLLGAILRAGYVRPFERLQADPEGAAEAADERRAGAGEIEFGPAGRVRLPAGVGIDPGGIGKGLAADIVCRELRRAGAGGACVNMGGDVRVSGVSPDGGGWTVAVEHPGRQHPLALVGLADGAVASSTTLLRRWGGAERPRHHLIDPRTGVCSRTAVEFSSVVAADAWLAEVLAKAALLADRPSAWRLLRASGAEGLRANDRGRIERTPGLGRYLNAAPAPAA